MDSFWRRGMNYLGNDRFSPSPSTTPSTSKRNSWSNTGDAISGRYSRKRLHDEANSFERRTSASEGKSKSELKVQLCVACLFEEVDKILEEFSIPPLSSLLCGECGEKFEALKKEYITDALSCKHAREVRTRKNSEVSFLDEKENSSEDDETTGDEGKSVIIEIKTRKKSGKSTEKVSKSTEKVSKSAEKVSKSTEKVAKSAEKVSVTSSSSKSRGKEVVAAELPGVVITVRNADRNISSNQTLRVDGGEGATADRDWSYNKCQIDAKWPEETKKTERRSIATSTEPQTSIKEGLMETVKESQIHGHFSVESSHEPQKEAKSSNEQQEDNKITFESSIEPQEEVKYLVEMPNEGSQEVKYSVESSYEPTKDIKKLMESSKEPQKAIEYRPKTPDIHKVGYYDFKSYYSGLYNTKDYGFDRKYGTDHKYGSGSSHFDKQFKDVKSNMFSARLGENSSTKSTLSENKGYLQRFGLTKDVGRSGLEKEYELYNKYSRGKK